MSKIKKLIKNNVNNLFEEKYFEDMESNFGVGKESVGKEKAQFDSMEDATEKVKNSFKEPKIPGTDAVNKANKETGKDSIAYYKETAKKMKRFQEPDENQVSQSRIGEGLDEKDIPKVDRDESDEGLPFDGEDVYDVEALGAGKMSALKYDDEGSEKHDEFVKRNDELNDDDSTYKKLKSNAEKFKKYKYDKPNEYRKPPKVRVTNENKDMKYTDVKKENIFKANGKIVSEEQVLKLANKVPKRVRVDESVFAITDGDNYYRVKWDGEEPVITHSKNNKVMNESIESMKKMWEFDTRDTISTKKNITESGDDAFKRMFNQLRDTDGLIGGEEK